jgi:hypothetical protein
MSQSTYTPGKRILRSKTIAEDPKKVKQIVPKKRTARAISLDVGHRLPKSKRACIQQPENVPLASGDTLNRAVIENMKLTNEVISTKNQLVSNQKKYINFLQKSFVASENYKKVIREQNDEIVALKSEIDRLKPHVFVNNLIDFNEGMYISTM